MARAVFVAIFLIGLSLPAWQTLLAFAPETPVPRERRTVASKPTIDSVWQLGELPVQLARWFDDHFGFRPFLLRLKTQVDYSVFGTSARAHIGRDGWLFYRSIIDQRRFEGDRFYATHGPTVVRNLDRLNRALREKGIALIVTVNLLVDRLIPDILPAEIPKQPAQPAIDHMLARLQAVLGPSYLDMTAVMNEVMKTRRAFHKSDFHWNDPAAFAGAQAIVQRAAALTGRPAAEYRFALEVVERDWIEGGLALIIPLLSWYQERELFMKQTFVDSAGIARTADGEVWYQTFRSDGSNPALLPPIACIGDSFTWGLQAAGLQAHFRAAYFSTAWGRAPRLSDFIARLPDDTGVLLVQWMELTREAWRMLADEEDIERALAIIARREVR
jgi:hypothetical protein